MKEKDEDVAHRGMVSKSEKTPILAQFSNSPWTASGSSGILGYNFYRGTVSSGPYTKLNASLIGPTTYTDNSVSSGTTYYYVSTAVGNSSYSTPESVNSNEFTAVIP